MTRHRSRSPRTPAAPVEHRHRWWHEGSPEQRISNVRGARRLHARRRQLVPVELRNTPAWWPTLRHLIVVLAVLAPFATLRYGADIKSQVAAWKASRQTAHIISSLDAQPSAAAIEQLVPVLQKYPTQPTVIRKLAWVSSEHHPYQAITLFYRLHDLDQASFEDQLQLGRLLVKTDRQALGQEIFGRLMQEHPDAHEPWLECGHAALASGDPIKAETAFQQALVLKPDSADSMIALARILQTTGSFNPENPIIDSLLTLAENRLAAGDLTPFSKITIALTDVLHLSGTQKARLLAMTAKPEFCPIEMRLARHCMEAPEQMTNEDRARLESRWGAELAKVDTETRSKGLRWLQNLGKHDFVIAATDRPALYESGSELTVRLLSLLNTQHVATASRLVANPKAGFSKLHPQILAAFDAFRTHPPQSLGSVLSRLFQDTDPALQNADACYVIGMLALNAGIPDLALSALTRAVELVPSWTLPAEPLLVAARKSGRDSLQVLEILRKVSQLPASDALRKRIAYLKLLANRDITTTEHEIKILQSSEPGDPFVRLLAAFGRYKQSDFTSAIKGLVPLPNYKWHQGEAAVIVSIMASGGLLDQTLPLVTVIKKNNLFIEEKEMVSPWLESLAQSESRKATSVVRTVHSKN